MVIWLDLSYPVAIRYLKTSLSDTSTVSHRLFFNPYAMSDCIESSRLKLLYEVHTELFFRQQLPIERGGRTTVLSMNQYHGMYNSCKIPGGKIDTVVKY